MFLSFPEMKDLDLPDEWEVSEEETGGKNTDYTKYWYLLPITAFLIALVVFFPAPEEVEYTTLEINGIPFSSSGDVEKNLQGVGRITQFVAGFVGEENEASKNCLLEISEVLQSKVYDSGIGYGLMVGISDRNGVFIGRKATSIEGRNEKELWRACWAFSSAVSDITLKSEFSELEGLTKGYNEVSLVIEGGQGQDWPKMITALGNLDSSLGYLQNQQGFFFGQYLKNGDVCELHFSIPKTTEGNVTCPVESDSTLLVELERGNENAIKYEGNRLHMTYVNYDGLIAESLIMRDILVPGILTGIKDVELPTLY